MREVSLEKAKEIIADRSYDARLKGYRKFKPATTARAVQLLRFTRLVMETEVLSAIALDGICRKSHDLVHLSGVHKFQYNTTSHSPKLDELRCFWGIQWEHLRHVPHMQDYIETVCENAGGRERSGHIGLFFRPDSKPWRTSEWQASQELQLKHVRLRPRAEFYPYIADNPTKEHALLLQVDSLVPKGLRSEVRADICQDMLVDVIGGKFTVGDLRELVPSYVRRFFKQNPVWGRVSIDAPIFGDGRRTLAEILAAPEPQEKED